MRPSPLPKTPPPIKTCKAGSIWPFAFNELPWKPIEAIPCWPQLFIQPLILIVISLLYKNSGYSSSITSLKAIAVLVLLLIPRLHVSVPGQLVTSATDPNPAAAKPSSSKTLYTYSRCSGFINRNCNPWLMVTRTSSAITSFNFSINRRLVCEPIFPFATRT